MLTLLLKGDQTKYLKVLWLNIFPFATGSSTVQSLSCEYLRECSKKFETDLLRYSDKLIHEKKSEVENLVALPL